MQATRLPSTRYTSRPSSTSRAEMTHLSNTKSLNICAKLTTISSKGKREAIVLSLNKQVNIGRDRRKCYVIEKDHVSAIHCQVNVVRSPNGGIIISCQDLSRNGIIWNGHRIKKTSVILMDGDTIEIPHALTFTCHHLWKDTRDKQSFFDPTPPLQPAQKRISGYIVTSQCLGTGSFATVHLALDPGNCRQVACKTIKTRKDSEVRSVTKEIAILRRLCHPNINQILAHEESGRFIHIFLQLCTGGDLFTYITSYAEKNSRLCESEVKYIGYQLLLGLKYLHDHSISHRDLKPENILLHSPGAYPRILIADFGLARPNAHEYTRNVCGTVSYLPPEGILALADKDLAYVGLPADAWSLGVILYVMLTGTHPFDNFESDSRACNSSWFNHIQNSHDLSSQFSHNYVRTEDLLKRKIIDGFVDFHHLEKTPAAKSVIGDLLIHDYKRRATVYDALQSEWIQSEVDLLRNIYENRIVGSIP